MNDIEKIKRHLSKPIAISIKDDGGVEDTFYFKPLNVEQQAILQAISKEIRSREEYEVEIEENGKMVKKKVPNILKEDMMNMVELIENVVKNSLSFLDENSKENEGKSDEEKEEIIKLRKDFCNDNFEQLSDAIFKLIPENTTNTERLKRLKQRMGVNNESSETKK